MVRDGLCAELDKLRASYIRLDDIMAGHMSNTLVPVLRTSIRHPFA